MKLKRLPLFVTLFSISVVMGMVIFDYSRLTSPGPLHPSHAGVGELKGWRGCAQCHADRGATRASACLACHQPIELQLQSLSGIHGSLDAIMALACATCHIEHVGGVAPLVSDLSFLEAGFAEPEHYDHSHVNDFGLSGRHLELACNKCHFYADASSLLPGEFRFIGLNQHCTSCHDDPHEGTLPECATCHGQEEPFELVADFEHDERFPLQDGHANVACLTCHDPQSSTSIAQLTAYKPKTVRACNACHFADFEQTTAPPHSLAGFAQECVDCHDTVQWVNAEI